MDARVANGRVLGAVKRWLVTVSSMPVLIAAGAVGLPVASAQADIINLNACNVAPLSQPFAPWGDLASYELAPGGDFETSAWQLEGGARRVSGSERFAATGTLGSWSVDLPAGGSAQSPATCVDAAYPTIRFFESGSGLVAVSVVYGNLTIPAGVAVVAGGWSPSLIALTQSAVVGLTSDGSAQVSVRLTTLLGDVRVDDVFVDPWYRG